jgi:hypothetical protein
MLGRRTARLSGRIEEDDVLAGETIRKLEHCAEIVSTQC